METFEAIFYVCGGLVLLAIACYLLWLGTSHPPMVRQIRRQQMTPRTHPTMSSEVWLCYQIAPAIIRANPNHIITTTMRHPRTINA